MNKNTDYEHTGVIILNASDKLYYVKDETTNKFYRIALAQQDEASNLYLHKVRYSAFDGYSGVNQTFCIFGTIPKEDSRIEEFYDEHY